MTFLEGFLYSGFQLLEVFYLYRKPTRMKKAIFKTLSKINKKVLPSYSKRQLDLAKATKLQKAILGWKIWVTKNSL